MIEREPSRTAFAAASYRAVHQVLEGGRVFSDRLAVPILGMDAEAIRADVAEHAARRGIRFFVVARARLAEDAVLRAVETRGVRQLVVLGAGLDTFGYRHAFGDRLRVFEVDHPATQAWKRRRLGEAGIEVPASLTYAPMDFERDSLAEKLAAAGLRPEVPTFFTWLGVVPYLVGWQLGKRFQSWRRIRAGRSWCSITGKTGMLSIRHCARNSRSGRRGWRPRESRL